MAKFFGQNVKIQESFRDDDNIQYAYYIGTDIAVFRHTDLDSGKHVQILKWKGSDAAEKAENKYNEYWDFVSKISAVEVDKDLLMERIMNIH